LLAVKKTMKTSVKIIAFSILLPFSCSTLSYAGIARVMSDYELDQVHAGGLNLDFDKFLGSFSSASDTVSKGGVTDTAAALSSPIVVDNNGKKVQIVEIKTPNTPKLPNVPVAPKAPNTAGSLQQDLPDVPDVPDVPVAEVNLALATAPEAAQSVAPDMTVVDTASSAVSGATSDLANIVPTAPVAAANVPDGSAAVNSLPVTNSAASAVSSPTAPTSPVAPTAPQAPASPAMRFDVVAGQNNGKFAVAVSDQSVGAAGAPLFTASSPGSQNFLNVTDTAQQNLEALVNVNAAGSVVPVQLNLTVLVNSNVGNLNLSNQLDLNSFSTYQF